jgi:hypothetical protein
VRKLEVLRRKREQNAGDEAEQDDLVTSRPLMTRNCSSFIWLHADGLRFRPKSLTKSDVMARAGMEVAEFQDRCLKPRLVGGVRRLQLQGQHIVVTPASYTRDGCSACLERKSKATMPQGDAATMDSGALFGG